jgi:hypothetical protein
MFLYFLPKSMLIFLCIQFSMSCQTLLQLLANSTHTQPMFYARSKTARVMQLYACVCVSCTVELS